MKIKFFLAGTGVMIAADLEDAAYADLVVKLRNSGEWVEGMHAGSGWPVLLNLAQVAQIERAAS